MLSAIRLRRIKHCLDTFQIDIFDVFSDPGGKNPQRERRKCRKCKDGREKAGALPVHLINSWDNYFLLK